jgi:UDP-N-acetylmuramate dehydrogenase
MTCSIPEHSDTPVATIPPLPFGRQRQDAHTLADLTTMGVGGPFARLVEATTEEEIIHTITEADSAGVPLLVVGGGSNILAADQAFEGVVLRDTRSHIALTQEGGCEGVNLHVLAGTPWDTLVVRAIENEWSGIEALSGIPGTVGAAPVQNIGAYGHEISSTVARVHTWDRVKGERREFASDELGFGYRTSVLKESLKDGWSPSPRYIVLAVDFQLRIASLSAPVLYGQLARRLGVPVGARVPASEVRAAVLDLRRSKGMVLDDADRDTYSCGSFFTNPVLTEAQAAELPADAPRYDVVDNRRATLNVGAPRIPGLVKTSAAWLIDYAGFHAGYGMPGPAALSTKHCLALTNRGGATSADIKELAQTIQQGVRGAYGITLQPEPIIVGGSDA